MPLAAMPTVRDLRRELKQLKKLSPEIRHKLCIDGRRFSAGLIAFAPGAARDRRQIVHSDRDVLCYVIAGRGRLRARRRTHRLRPGMLCHIPKRTPHDFAATDRRLVLWYALIEGG